MTGAERRLRLKLVKLIADADDIEADAAYTASRRPESAPKFAPDSFAEMFRTRRWAREAVAALDHGLPIPPMPRDCEGATNGP